jgi:hypothetical protein
MSPRGQELPGASGCFYPGENFTQRQREIVERWARVRALEDINRPPDNPDDPERIMAAANEAFCWDKTPYELIEFLDEAAYFQREEFVRIWTIDEDDDSPFSFNPQKTYVPTREQIEIANRTARSGGAVGSKALVPRLVRDYAKPSDTILDFGSGPKAMHTMDLRKDGFYVVPYDFGRNITPGIHDPEALNFAYDFVFASNVLNVQSSQKMFDWTLGQIVSVMAPGGKLLANYPESPRKGPMNQNDVEMGLKAYFSNVERVGGTKRAPVFLAWND